MSRARAFSMAGLVAVGALLVSGCLVVGEPAELAVPLARANDVNDDGLIVGSRWPTEPLQIVDRAYRHDPTTGATTDLGTLGGSTSTAWAVNDLGTIVGESTLASGQTRAFRYTTASGMVDLGTLHPVATVPTSTASDINVSGVVVGSSNVETGTVDATHAFALEPASGTMTDLGTLGGTSSSASAVNDAGIVVGRSDIAGDVTEHAFAYDLRTGVMTDLGSLGVSSGANDVNEAGVVTGGFGTPREDLCAGCSTVRPFVLDLATGDAAELGSPGGYEYVVGTSINEGGVVVGTASSTIGCSHCPAPQVAIAWESGTTGVYTIAGRDHGAQAINDTGLVVGSGFTFDGGWVVTPFAWSSQVTLERDD